MFGYGTTRAERAHAVGSANVAPGLARPVEREIAWDIFDGLMDRLGLDPEAPIVEHQHQAFLRDVVHELVRVTWSELDADRLGSRLYAPVASSANVDWAWDGGRPPPRSAAKSMGLSSA
ncbi:MAG: hypothetical protein AAF683_03720 [Pseudomonadota bacterium]